MNLWWIRRDLRLKENPALDLALQEGRGVVPVFILDEHLLSVPAEARQNFLLGGLRVLDKDLRARGSRLILRRGDPAVEIPRLAAECRAGRVFAEQDYSPYARERDEQVAAGVDLQLVHGRMVHPPGAVLSQAGRPYTVFTPFSRAWKALPLGDVRANPPLPELNPVPALVSEPIPEAPIDAAYPPGEAEADGRLAEFLAGPIFVYAAGRDRLALDGTSRLSPYLRFGMLSPARAVSAALQAAREAPDARAREGCGTWLNELIWREFYITILADHPEVLTQSFRPSMQAFPWRDAQVELQAWQEGLTGYPVVDAAMRQLRESGWMHNRARMIAASFLVKHLLIHWQAGERWFLRHLVDGDPAANNGGWQWVAGTGTDTAPYFRIFNPVLQGRRFDPEGEYVRRWVPELARVPDRSIHAPWEMTLAEQQACGTRIGRDYPAPIVEHAFARERALAALRAAGRQVRSKE